MSYFLLVAKHVHVISRRREANPEGLASRPPIPLDTRSFCRGPGHLAGQGDLVPGHEPAAAGRPARGRQSAPAGPLAEVARIYGIRHWIEQSYKQVKDELGWADFQVRSGTAIRRHQALVSCAFCFCCGG